jgi:hypothetical protein
LKEEIFFFRKDMPDVRMTGKQTRKIWIHIWTLRFVQWRRLKLELVGMQGVEATFVPIRPDHHWSRKETHPPGVARSDGTPKNKRIFKNPPYN